MLIKPIKKSINKKIEVPSDKSITHRALILSSIADGKSTIFNPLECYDTHNTLKCMEKLGARVDMGDKKIIVNGVKTWRSCSLDVGNSGTTIRLLAGLLSGFRGEKFILDGDESIRRRPMQRVIEPLELMGAVMKSNATKAPISIEGQALKGIDYSLKIPSAQVKSALLLAGLNASGKTTIQEPTLSRNHSELMLRAFGADIERVHDTIKLNPSVLKSTNINICGDISSVAFFLVLCACLKNSCLKIKNVGVNSTRTGIIEVMKRSGAKINFSNQKNDNGEVCADIEIESSELKPFHIVPSEVPLLIDEIPILCVLACFIEGVSIVEGCGELKHKESNRLSAIVEELKKLGANIEISGTMSDTIRINGQKTLKGGQKVLSNSDHRIAMSLAVALTLSNDGGEILGSGCVGVSYSNFFETLKVVSE
ncbi:MAG: 3-phosphoshikimate 1-carboxyvinyltransferase [Firmicutes bacterium]|nr:3-phosphoshikimate 1-carboxyvinyltransferase [Bacillota bacterium]MCL2256177.1 3-phosphoshikimate 1-carboxyvinyltransferase [Bacillota bacterium]